MKNFILIAFLFLSTFVIANDQMEYHRVKVFADVPQLHAMQTEGLCVDHGELRIGHYLINEYDNEELEFISDLGIEYEILIEDMATYYATQNAMPKARVALETCANDAPNYPVPSNFQLGTYAGFFSYQEMLDHLEAMHQQYPQFVSEPAPASDILSIEGREILYVKFSDNVNVDEDEPEIFYNAIHHAREPNGLSQLIFYMWYLLENYEADEEVRYLVDNLEMYFMPCINPDGYIYNEQTNPNGGGYWRKNRRQNQGNTIGVDLNRNYGYNWGYDDQGSSGNPDSNVYRGTEGFSEPETQVVKEFCEAHEFKIALNYHTYGNLLIYPWGYDYGLFTTDSAQFVKYAQLFTEFNEYTYGTGDQTVGYIVNGSSDDWMYGEQTTKPKILAMTPEVGTPDFGFYPPMEEIIPNCQKNMWQNLHAAKVILNYAIAEDKTPIFLEENAGLLEVDIQRLGMEPGDITLSINPISGIASVGASVDYNGLTLLQTETATFQYELDANLQPGDEVVFEVAVDNGIYVHKKEYTKIYLPNPIVKFEDAGDDNNQWQGGGGWGTTVENAVSGTNSLTDSPYSNMAGGAVDMESNLIDLSLATTAVLRFNAIWDIEARYDYAQISIKPLGTSNWEPLCGKYTKTGNSYQDFEQPIYDGFQGEWVLEEIDISAYVGQEVQLRFRAFNDGWTGLDGMYVDDIEVLVYELNNAPIAQDDVINIATGETVNIDVLENDTEPDNEELSITWVELPQNGTVEIDLSTPTPSLNYTPNDDFGGADEFSYVICDVANNCDTGLVTVNVAVGITDNNQFPQVEFYPNPVNDLLYINHLNEAGEIGIYDVAGKLIQSINHNGNKATTINTSAISNGVYYLKFAQNRQLTTLGKLVVIH